MAIYVFDLHDSEDHPSEVRKGDFASDDHAIDHARRLNHPHEIRVWRGKRLVAELLSPTRRG